LQRELSDEDEKLSGNREICSDRKRSVYCQKFLKGFMTDTFLIKIHLIKPR